MRTVVLLGPLKWDSHWAGCYIAGAVFFHLSVS